MPTTSSPWASPSSPAGRRLLLSEPATADDIPVLDDATLALGAALGAAPTAPAPTSAPAVRAHPARRTAALASVRRAPRRGLVAAALVVSLLAIGTTAGLERPAPAATTQASTAASAPSMPHLGHAAGIALAADRVAAGDVAVGLIAPTESVRADGKEEDPLARRLGTLMALEAAQLSIG